MPEQSRTVSDRRIVADLLSESIRSLAKVNTADQTSPCVILWPDPDSLWSSVIGELKELLPELFELGAIERGARKGPAIWLRCIEGRSIEPKLAAEVVPIFYLPGVSRQTLRAIEELSPELQPIAELQFRGVVWVHPNGKEWTPSAFLGSDRGGLNLDLLRDQASLMALQRALGSILKKQLRSLQHRRLDVEFFNNLLAADMPREVLLWMSAPDAAKRAKNRNEWLAFCDQCIRDYGFHPEKDGELRAADLLTHQEGNWTAVWHRFVEAPEDYEGVILLLQRTTPSTTHPEASPGINKQGEADLRDALGAFPNLQPSAARVKLLELEKVHAPRRKWVWQELGHSPLATALEHLATLAKATGSPMAAPSAAAIAELYAAEGWKTDHAAMNALASAKESADLIGGVVRCIYLPWIEESCRNLQELARKKPRDIRPRSATPTLKPGQVFVFVDGFRMDCAKLLSAALDREGLQVGFEWDWAPFPSLTAVAKPFVSPVREKLEAGEADETFALRIKGTSRELNHDRFKALLGEQGVEVLESADQTPTKDYGWFESAEFDHLGHSDGLRLAELLAHEIQQVAADVSCLLSSGWKEVIIVTDHGWLLMPGDLPRIQLPQFLADHKWGRCAAVKPGIQVEHPTLPWYWNDAIIVATPPGAGVFRAGMAYAHGGLSPQESIVPRLTVRGGSSGGSTPRISEVKWVGLRCKIAVSNGASGLKADVRRRQADAASSLVEGNRSRELAADGTVSLPIGDDRNQGEAAVIVLLSPTNQVLQSMPTVIGENQ